MKQIEIPFKEMQIIEVDDKRYKITIEPLGLEDCICGCGRPRASQKSKYASDACRSKFYRMKKNKILN